MRSASDEIAVAERRQSFLAGMSQAAATVSVVTTDGPAGRSGVTVSAMSSVSADEPTLLVCIHHQSQTAAAILRNSVFCVNLLRDDQSVISESFAGRQKAMLADKFACSAWTSQITGAPRLIDPLVAFDCRLLTSQRVGTHHVLLGAVEDVYIGPSGSPLIYANRAYGTAARL
jgi:flavin reductase (DIM6/NTAB) family NADH-FMN oxidoreductase RutF